MSKAYREAPTACCFLAHLLYESLPWLNTNRSVDSDYRWEAMPPFWPFKKRNLWPS